MASEIARIAYIASTAASLDQQKNIYSVAEAGESGRIPHPPLDSVPLWRDERPYGVE